MRETLEQRIAALAPGLDVLRPSRPGPHPVFIQFHGCGGKKRLQGEWAKMVSDHGWAAVIVDSYAHRGISTLQAYATVCTALRLWGQERAGDLFAALEWVRRQPWADTSRMVLGGWSHGGWTALDAMAMRPGAEVEQFTRLKGVAEEPLAGVAGAFLVYPFAGPITLAPSRGLRIDARPLAIAGGADVIVGGRALTRTLARMQTPGDAIRVEFFKTATHAFDERESRDLRTRYDDSLTARAHDLLRGYLSTF